MMKRNSGWSELICHDCYFLEEAKCCCKEMRLEHKTEAGMMVCVLGRMCSPHPAPCISLWLVRRELLNLLSQFGEFEVSSDVCLGWQISIIMAFVLDTVKTDGWLFLEKRRGCSGGKNPEEQASLSWGAADVLPTALLRPPDTKQLGHSLYKSMGKSSGRGWRERAKDHVGGD